LKKLNSEKNRLNRLKFLKKPTGSVRFGSVLVYKPKTEKTKPNPNQKNRAKPEKAEPNWFEPVFILKNQTEPNRTETGQFEPASVRFF